MFTTEEQSTVIPNQFLWAVGLNSEVYPPGALIENRYRVVEDQIVLDTKMYSMPEMPEELTELAVKYLKLTRYALHLPQPYALLHPKRHDSILILENSPLDERGQLLPSITEAWREAKPLRQVNWLWQICKLWKPLHELQVSSSLLNLSNLRVRDCWVQLVELTIDYQDYSLSQLGEALVPLIADCHADLTEELTHWLEALQSPGATLEAAIAHLDRLASDLAQLEPMTVRIAGMTDIGLRRDHNEDACYPMLDQPQVEGLRNRVLIICDGLGGHEGGEIASGTAIKTITRMLNTLLHQVEQDTEPFSAQAFIAQLDKIVKVANDQIVALNDQQQRQGQQRMGTTLVMAVVPSPQGRAPHEVYIVHVGDSRAYWIGKNKHYQITADDDVATRETVLGYSFYPYSAQRLDAGALIQALGTRPSGVLLPRIQRFIIDEDCLFLLCSDGLSDYDRVDYLADSHLRPILQKNIPLEDACRVLIAQANALNGHDNISVGLLRCAFGPIIESPDTEPDQEDLTILQEKTDEDEVAEIAQAIQAEAIAAGIPVDPIAPYTPPVVPRQEKKSQSNNWLFVVLTIVGVVLAIGLVAALFRQQGKNNSSPRNHVPSVQELT